MNTYVTLLMTTVLASCGQAYGGKPTKAKTTVEPCVAERIDEGVRITCPTSEAIVYDGIDGAAGTDGATGETGAQGEQGETGPQGVAGEDGQDGTSCTVTGAGLVQCGETEYQLPYLSDDTC